MTDQRRVWAVSTGEYSDYSVVAYFSSEELANRYADIHNDGKPSYSDRYCVEDGELIHDEVPEPVEVLRLTVQLARPTPRTPDERIERLVPGIDGGERGCEVYANRMFDGRWFLQVHGTDHTRVRKAMSERMARVIAEWDVTT